MVLEAVIFDMDGVIINSEELADKENKRFFEDLGIKYERDAVKHLLSGKGFLDNTKIILEYYKLDGDYVAITEQRIEERKRLYQEELQFIPGFNDFLVKVKEQNLSSAVATGSSKELLAFADNMLNLSQLFDNHIYCTDLLVCACKPSPDIFLYAANALATNPQNCLVIEDSPSGIEAALAANMKVIGITTTFQAEILAKATKVVDSFSEIDLKQY